MIDNCNFVQFDDFFYISNGKYLVQCVYVLIFFALLLYEYKDIFFMSSFFQVICFILAISFLMHTMDSNVNIYCSLSLYFIRVVFLYNESIIFELDCFKTIILK